LLKLKEASDPHYGLNSAGDHGNDDHNCWIGCDAVKVMGTMSGMSSTPTTAAK